MPIPAAFLAVFISSLPVPAMTCQIQVEAKEGATPREIHSDIILTNNTSKAIEIPWTLHPLQYLDLKITGPDGKQLVTDPFFWRFSPFTDKPIILTIKPGESYQHGVGLFGGIKEADRKSGVYKFRAIYRYQGQKFESAEVKVSVTFK
ncbi:MAG: hypothetical protein ACRC8S_19635 [Fimbriiglobus sp.]